MSDFEDEDISLLEDKPEESEKKRFTETNQWCVKIALKALRVGLLVAPTMEMCTIMLSAAFLALCFWKGKTFAEIIPLITPFIVAYKPLKALGNVQVSLQSARAALNRIYSFLDIDTSLPLASNPIRKTSFDKALVFDHVDFSYNVCNTAPSCMFTLFPIRIEFTSPRRTVLNQKLQSSPMMTSPMIAALSAK